MEINVTEKSLEDFEEETTRQSNIHIVSSNYRQPRLRRIMKAEYNPWSAEDVDKYASRDIVKEYREIVDSCRFFYRRDPLASIVINKLVDIGVSELQLIKGNVPDNKYRLYETLLPELQEFIEVCGLEYLITGVVIPEVDFQEATKKRIMSLGVKKYNSLAVPTNLWVRDPSTLIINSPLIGQGVSYYVEIPSELVAFITSEGRYEDGTEDKDLYEEIKRTYPEIVVAVRAGENKLQLEDPLVFRRKVLSDSPYPTPYLYGALESLRHKRNIRRMDYSIAARVISAIMHVKVGSDEYPLVAEDDIQLDELQAQMTWPDSAGWDIERIFQLFTNHVVEIGWVFPDTEALLDDAKYSSINQDIIWALGFPAILINGETQRSQSSDAKTALVSPIKTMENMRRRIIQVAQYIMGSIAERNNWSEVPDVQFSPMNLVAFQEFMESLQNLYDTGNLSRTDYAKVHGYDFEDQITKRAEENKRMKALGIEEFAPVPHSNAPQNTSKPAKEDKNQGESGE